MDWGIKKTRMITALERLLGRGWLEAYHGCLSPLTRRWPSMPWRAARIEIRFYEQAMSYWLVHGNSQIPISRSEALEPGLPWVLILPTSRVLKRQLTIPSLKGADLTSVLAHEVSRHTPYQQDAVSFTWRAQKNTSSNLQDIELWVLPLTHWQQLVMELPDLATRCTQVDVELSARETEGINLLPKTQQARLLAPRVNVAGVLLAIATVAVLWSMHRVLENRAGDVVQWQEKIAVLENDVRPVKQLQAAVRRQQQLQVFIKGLNSTLPSKLEVLAQLSQCLPSDAVLDRISMQGNTLSLDGMASSPEALIPAMACASSLKLPSLVGTMQTDTQNNKQRFSLTAQMQGHTP